MGVWGLSIIDRLEIKTIPVTECGCHIWMGALNKKGYGIIKVKGKVLTTHRANWVANFGEIPNNLHVLHKCDIKPCINLDHLFLGTNIDNIHDKMAKMRFRHGENHHKTT